MPTTNTEDLKKGHDGGRWKILIADDEADVHDITKLVLHDFSYMAKSLHFLSAFSAREAKLLIAEHPDVAVILLDAVMETDDAGLQLVDYIRKGKGMTNVRIVLRTGQAGHAPERYVIDNYDIDDYKNKSELTSQRLYTTIRSALKNYRDLRAIEKTKHSLEKIIENSLQLYSIESEEEILTAALRMFYKLVDAMEKDPSPPSFEKSGFAVLLEENGCERIFQGIGRFENSCEKYLEKLDEARAEIYSSVKKTGENHFGEDAVIMVFKNQKRIFGFCYLDVNEKVSENGQRIVEIFFHQVTAFIETHLLYKRLLQSERMAAVGQIAGGLLHDVKNAMAGIQLSTQLIKDPNIPLEKKIKICDIVASKFSWIQEMIEDIFNFSRGWQSLRLESVPVMKVVEPVLEWLESDAQGKGISVQKNVSFQGKVRADDVKIKRCLVNLCKNALDAMLKGDQGRKPELSLAITGKEGRACFSVSDNGCGIDKKYLPRIWEPFFTLEKKEGTGLGLPLVKQIIEGHGGRVAVDTQVGKGTTFSFDLEIVE